MRFLLLLLYALLVSQVTAKEPDQGAESVRESMNLLLPGLPLGEITPSPIAGIYEVVIGQKISYVSADGHYLIQGTLIDLELQKNLTEPRLNKIKADAMAALDENNMLSFGPKDAKHTVTVFTDIDCGYCRKLHKEIDSYGEKGIRIRYLFYPRAGVGSDSFKKAVSVWCADDSKQAMTLAKSGKPIELKTCDNPVQHDMKLGEQMGVNGTPAMVLENGKMIPGYVPAGRLGAILDSQNDLNKN